MIAAIAGASPTWAGADVRVQGDYHAVSIEATEAPVVAVLSALSGAFLLRYRASISLEGNITGTYRGALPRVLARLLDGYNFVIKRENGQVEVQVFGRRGDGGINRALPQAPPVATPAVAYDQH